MIEPPPTKKTSKVIADDTNQDRMRSFIVVFKASREYVAEYATFM